MCYRNRCDEQICTIRRLFARTHARNTIPGQGKSAVKSSKSSNFASMLSVSRAVMNEEDMTCVFFEK